MSTLSTVTPPWSPESWRERPIRQQPQYAEQDAVEDSLARVRKLPPLVSAGEVLKLRASLAQAARGKAFLLQGGDCAERFADCTRTSIEAKLKILLQMSLVLTWGARIPVIRVARIAGQYAKPRSSDTETVDGAEYPSYRGDHVNGHMLPQRQPDPGRLVDAYFHSAATLNYIRALIDGGFADLRHPRHWDLAFVRSSTRRAEYEDVVGRILDALNFVEGVGVSAESTLSSVDFYSSHEGLLLPYESAQTSSEEAGWFNLGAHMLWVGHRTRHIDEAHVEYFRGIENPIGIKVGPGLNPDDLLALLDRVEPHNRAGRITLITRFGADQVLDQLPPLIQAVQAEGRTVVWSCDPMHGNTTTTNSGRKTREVRSVLRELSQVLNVHRACGSHLGGVHFELTGENVTECIGGPEELQEADLERQYESFCDPRLNYAQSLELAFQLAAGLR